jgi:CRISPR-associated protein Cas2
MFIVLVAHAIPEHLRGYTSRFLTQVDPATYVGVASRRVVDELWSALQENAATGSMVLVESDNSECGYRVRTCGDRTVRIVDYDGWPLAVRVRT